MICTERHNFRPYPGPHARLFCKWCGAEQDAGSSTRTTSRPPRRSRSRRAGEADVPLPFEDPVAQAEADLVRAMREQLPPDLLLDAEIEDVIPRRRDPDDPEDDRLGNDAGL